MSAETARLASQHHKLGKPGGPGLFHDKSQQLPAYIQNIADALMKKRGMPKSQAIQVAIGTVKRWASGGGDVKPEVRAAAAKAVAEWEAAKAKARATPNKSDHANEREAGAVELAGAVVSADDGPRVSTPMNLRAQARQKAASQGYAMPDGSYPIRNVAELKKAIQAIGRAKDPAAVKRHIKKRAAALKAAGMIPQDWSRPFGEWGTVDLAAGPDTSRLGMIALEVPAGTIPQLPGGVPQDDMHVTLAFLGADVSDMDFARAINRAYNAASDVGAPLTGWIGGIGVFPADDDGKRAAWATVDVQGLDNLRAYVSRPMDETHGFTPHVTVKWLAEGDAVPAPVAKVPVTFTTLIVKRGEETLRLPLGGGKDYRYTNIPRALLDLARPAEQGDQPKKKQPQQPPHPRAGVGKDGGPARFKHGWIPVDKNGNPTGPAEPPPWLKQAHEAQIKAGGRTWEQIQAAKKTTAQKAAESAAKKSAAAKKKASTMAKAEVKAEQKQRASLLKEKARRETAATKAAKKAADQKAKARTALLNKAYRQALADQKAGRTLTPAQQRVMSYMKAQQAKDAAALRKVDVPGQIVSAAATAQKATPTKPAKVVPQPKAIPRGRGLRIRSFRRAQNHANAGGVNVLEFSSEKPAGHLAFRYKHGWILINPAIPSRGRHGGGLAKYHGHKSGTVTKGHFEKVGGKTRFVAESHGHPQPSVKQPAIVGGKVNYKKADTKSKYTTAANQEAKGDALKPAPVSKEAAAKKSVAAAHAATQAQKSGTLADAQNAAKLHADAYVANKKAGNDAAAQAHHNTAQAWSKKAVQLKKAQKASEDAKAKHDAEQKAKADAAAAEKAKADAEKNANLEKLSKLAKKAKEADDVAAAAPNAAKAQAAHVAAAKAHKEAADFATSVGLKLSAASYLKKASEHQDKVKEINAKKEALKAASEKADAQSAAVEGHDVNAFLHNKIAAKHTEAAKLAQDLGGLYTHIADHHNEKAAEHTAAAKAKETPEPPKVDPTGAINGVIIGLDEFTPGDPSEWHDFLSASLAYKQDPTSANAKKLAAAQKKLKDAHVTSTEMQQANAKLFQKMGLKSVAGKKTAAKKPATKPAAPAAPAAPSTPSTPSTPGDAGSADAKDWEIDLPGPGMYKDGNAIMQLMNRPTMDPAQEDAKKTAVSKALADFKKKHGKTFDPNSVELDYSTTSKIPQLSSGFFDDAKKAGYTHPDPATDVTGGWKPPAHTKGALLNYTGSGYTDINNALRQVSGGYMSSYTRDEVKQIDAAFEDSPGVKENLVTIRKMKNNGQFPANPPPMSAGDEYVDYGYGSTSKSTAGWSGNVIMEVRIPKGTKAIDVNHNGVVSCSTSEQEIILPRGARYRVVKDEMIGGQRRIVTEVVSTGETHPKVKL